MKKTMRAEAGLAEAHRADKSPIVAYWPMAVIGGTPSCLGHVRVEEYASVAAARDAAESRANYWARAYGDDTYIVVQHA